MTNTDRCVVCNCQNGFDGEDASIVRAMRAKSFLYIFGLLTCAERERVEKRINKMIKLLDGKDGRNAKISKERK